MPNLIIIFGPPAAGKAAIGHELAALTGYRFFHNYLTADPAAALFGWGSEKYTKTVDTIREVLLREAAADASISGVIFTFLWGIDLPTDTALLKKISALFVDAARARQVAYEGKYVLNTDGQLPLDYPHLVLDTETLTPVDAAQRIKAALAALPSKA